MREQNRFNPRPILGPLSHDPEPLSSAFVVA